MPRETKASARMCKAREHEFLAFEMRKQGYTFQQIADSLGVTDLGAHKMVMRTLERLATQTAETAEQVRAMEIERLNELWRHAWEQVENGELRAIDVCLNIQNRRARLMGLDAATKVDLSGTVGVRQYEGVNVDDV